MKAKLCHYFNSYNACVFTDACHYFNSYNACVFTDACHYFNSYNACAFTDACHLNTSENLLLNNNRQKIIAYTFLLALHICLCTICNKWWRLAWEICICWNNGTSQPMGSYIWGVVPRRLETRSYVYVVSVTLLYNKDL